jgi:DNA replication protein DnaC
MCTGNGFKDRGWFEYIPSFLLLAKNFEDKEKRQEHINNLLNRDLVVLDDIGAVRNTQYDITVLSDIINTRYSKRLATIFTSNVAPTDLDIDQRLVNRLESDIVIEIKGKSRRESTSTYKRKSEVGEPVVRSRVSNHF